MDRTQRRPKPYHVHFDPGRSTGAERSALYGLTKTYPSNQSADGGVLKSKVGDEGGKENNEYLVEPRALNELESQQSMEYEPHGAYVSKTSPLKSDSSRAATYKPGRTLSSTRVQSQAGSSESRTLSPSSSSAAYSHRYDSTVHFSVPPTTTTASTLHPSPPSHPHTVATSTYHLSTASPSNPNTIGSPGSRPASTFAPHSNATAVFGPPVKFGDHASRQSRHPTMVRPAEVCIERDTDSEFYYGMVIV